MSGTFGRPPFIRPGSIVPLPNTCLDQPAENPAVPSPVLIEVLQNQLSTQLSSGGSVAAYTTSLHAKVDSVKRWMDSFPRVFGVQDPDTSFDATFSYLPFQRLQLHCTGYMALLTILRPLLTTSIPQAETTDPIDGNKVILGKEGQELACTAVDIALVLMAKCRDLFSLCFPDSARNFMVAFYSFDTAATLCSALRHDQNRRTLPRRMEVVTAIGCALHISKELIGLTEIGKTTWNILSTLISRVDLSDVEKATVDEAMNAGRPVESQVRNDSLVQMPATNSLPWEDFDGSGGLWVGDANDLTTSQVDLGALDGAWHWDGINFNTF